MNDTTFKYLLKKEESRKWFERIIKEKINVDIRGYELYDNEINSGNKKKDYRMDIVLRKEEKIVIIEMNNVEHKYKKTSNYQYLYLMLGNGYDKGEEVRDRKVTLINLNNYYNRNERDIEVLSLRFRDDREIYIREEIRNYEIYLPKIRESSIRGEGVDRSIGLMTCRSYEEMREIAISEEDKKIIKELERLSMNDEFMIDYENVYRKHVNSARKEGYGDGVENGKIEVVNNMLNEGLSIELISKCTKLTIERVKEILDIK